MSPSRSNPMLDQCSSRKWFQSIRHGYTLCRKRAIICLEKRRSILTSCSMVQSHALLVSALHSFSYRTVLTKQLFGFLVRNSCFIHDHLHTPVHKLYICKLHINHFIPLHPAELDHGRSRHHVENKFLSSP